MSWIPDLYVERRRSRRENPPAVIEIRETRALLATVTVHVVNFAFNPSTVSIQVGDTVHWVWDTSNHTTTSVAGIAEQWDSGLMNAGSTFDHTFSHAGSFQYYCIPHGHDNGNGAASGMAGTVTVGTSTPTPTPTPTPTMGSLQSTGQNAVVKVNKTFQKPVAQFREPNTTPKDFTIMIDWGDQSAVTSGRIRRQGRGRFVAVGSHRYLTPGVFSVMVMIHDSAGQEVQALSSVRVKGK